MSGGEEKRSVGLKRDGSRARMLEETGPRFLIVMM